jgi:hypothetical protein
MIEQIPEELHGAMLKEFKTGWNFQKVMAEAQTQAVGKVNQIKAKSIDGIGQLQMRINADSFHYWGQRLGYDCWKDAAFRKRYMEKNPYCKVNSGGTKEIHVGFSGSSSTRNLKHRKVYA